MTSADVLPEDRSGGKEEFSSAEPPRAAKGNADAFSQS
jgi:hypothetical protein